MSIANGVILPPLEQQSASSSSSSSSAVTAQDVRQLTDLLRGTSESKTSNTMAADVLRERAARLRAQQAADVEYGAHCSLAECKQANFLPIVCAHCKFPFCEEHQLADKHACGDAQNLIVALCERCGAAVRSQSSALKDESMRAHLQICAGKPSAPSSSGCCVHKCSESAVHTFQCSTCLKRVCVKYVQPVALDSSGCVLNARIMLVHLSCFHQASRP